MKLKRDEQIKIENFKAQYNSILSNIKVANQELESVLSQIKENAINQERVESDLALKRSEIASIVQKQVDIDKHTSHRLNKLQEREETIQQKEQEFVGKSQQLKTQIDALQREIEQLQHKKDMLVFELNESIKSLVTQKEKLAEEQDLLYNSINDGRDELKQIQDSTVIHKNELGKLIQSTDKIYKEKLIELEKIEKKVFEAKEKIKKPNESLDKREQEILAKENNIRILTRRLKDLYREVKPGINISI